MGGVQVSWKVRFGNGRRFAGSEGKLKKAKAGPGFERPTAKEQRDRIILQNDSPGGLAVWIRDLGTFRSHDQNAGEPLPAASISAAHGT
jgi:hypothetical protein